MDSQKLVTKTNFKEKDKIEPIYTGGKIQPYKNGQFLLCTCGDIVNVIDVATGVVICKINQEGDDITCVCASHDNNIIVTASKSLLLKQWSITFDKVACVRSWKAIHVSVIVCMAYDATSSLLASGGSDGTIKCWDLNHQYCTHNLRGSQGVVNIVTFHPSELLVFSAATDYNIRVWDLNTSKCICLLENHVSAVTSLCFTTNHSKNPYLISSGRDSILSLWEISEVTKQPSIKPKKTIPVFEQIEEIIYLSNKDTELISSKESRTDDIHVLVAGNKGQLSVWNLRTGEKTFTQATENNFSTNSIKSFSYLFPCEQFNIICAVTEDHNIMFFNKESLALNRQLIGYNDEILDVKFIGEFENNIMVASNSSDLKIFNLQTRGCQLLPAHENTILSVDTFSNRTSFVSASKDKTVCLWRMLKDGKVELRAKGLGHTQAVTCVTCAKTKNKLFATGSEDQTFKIWKIKEKDDEISLIVLHTIKAHDKDVNCITISPNDKLIATGSQDKTAKLWKASDGSAMGVFRGHKRGIWKLQFSPMDQVLGTASADGNIKLWTLNTFTCFKTFEGHDSSILNLMFLSKGTQLMSSGSDGLVKLWNIKGNECVKTLEAHEDKIWGLACTKDEGLVATVSADSNIILWEDVTQKEDFEKRENDEQIILRHQELQNLIHEKSFVKALSLAITLEQPFTALNIIKEILQNDPERKTLEETICKMRNDQKDILLKFIMSWNTNARNCHEAHAVLNFIIKNTDPNELMDFSNIQEALEAILPYSEKHFDRVSRLYQQATFVDFIWQSMKIKPLSDAAKIPPLSNQSTSKPLFQIDIVGSGDLAHMGNGDTAQSVNPKSDKSSSESSDDSDQNEDKNIDDNNTRLNCVPLSQNSITSSGAEEDLGSDGDISIKKQKLSVKKSKNNRNVKGKQTPRLRTPQLRRTKAKS